ncbi:MAG: GxxExxY protein [Geobacteraceae bacterium]|nr:GxxExxY protein [Geobacteraceae bacterium]
METRRHRGTEKTLFDSDLTDIVIGCAIEVHRALGPGLLESAYEECLCYELAARDLTFEKQKNVPLQYKDVRLEAGYRLDLFIENRLVVELKCVEKILPVHEAQLMTYLRLTKVKTGLIINFFIPVLKDGIRRIVY